MPKALLRFVPWQLTLAKESQKTGYMLFRCCSDGTEVNALDNKGRTRLQYTEEERGMCTNLHLCHCVLRADPSWVSACSSTALSPACLLLESRVLQGQM